MPLCETAEPATKNTLMLDHIQTTLQGLSVSMSLFLRGTDVFALYYCVWEFLGYTVKDATYKH